MSEMNSVEFFFDFIATLLVTVYEINFCYYGNWQICKLYYKKKQTMSKSFIDIAMNFQIGLTLNLEGFLRWNVFCYQVLLIKYKPT